jgi:hypothetical protein
VRKKPQIPLQEKESLEEDVWGEETNKMNKQDVSSLDWF